MKKLLLHIHYITVAPDAFRFSLIKNRKLKRRYGKLEYTGRDNGTEYSFPIRSIQSCEVVGLASQLTEEQWKEAVGYAPFADYRKDNKNMLKNTFNMWVQTATESGSTLLRRHKLNPKTTLLIIRA